MAGEELGGVEGGEIISRIQCMRKESFNLKIVVIVNKRKN